jgi:hypothetical protein
MPTTRPGLRAIAIALTAPLFVFSLVPARAQLPSTNSGPASDVNGKPDHFDLRGIVVNSVTNEPVAGALVELLDAPQSRFSSADGTFVFSNLPVGDHQLNATKPGFSRINGRTSAISYSSTAAIDGLFPVRLTPEAIVYGEVKNEAGEPLEGVTVTLIRSGVVEGHRVRQSLEQSITDDEGNFRIASISPGSFRLFFLPANHGWSSYKIVHKKQSAPGYGTEYYPGPRSRILNAYSAPRRLQTTCHTISISSAPLRNFRCGARNVFREQRKSSTPEFSGRRYLANHPAR